MDMAFPRSFPLAWRKAMELRLEQNPFMLNRSFALCL